MVNKDFDRLSTTLYALSDPTRRAILARLALGESAVGELAQPFDMTLPAISKHLKVLERAGLIARGRDAQRRPCRLAAEPLREVLEWVADYRQFWDQRLDRLEAYLEKKEKACTQTQMTRCGGGPRLHARRAISSRRGLVSSAPSSSPSTCSTGGRRAASLC